MNLRLTLASLHLPASVKRRKLAELLRRTADAFAVPAPDVGDQSLAERVRTFAAFTTEQAERVCRGDGATAVAATERLRAAAYELGAGIRRELRIRGAVETMRAAWLLYRTLGIDFDGRPDGATGATAATGRIVIRRCYFADWYTPRVCALMGALDEGLLAGLAGDGRLEFQARITEGRLRCRATFHFASLQAGER